MSEESSSRRKAREAFVLGIFARFESATGKPIDMKRTDELGRPLVDRDGNPVMTRRRQAILEELNLRQVGQRHLEAAREWILRGDPARYGRITLADFFPDEEKLKSLGMDIGALLSREYRRGKAEGFREGMAAEQRAEKERAPRIAKAEARALKIREAVAFVTDRKRLDEQLAAVEEREAELLKREGAMYRSLRRIGFEYDTRTGRIRNSRGFTNLGDALPSNLKTDEDKV